MIQDTNISVILVLSLPLTWLTYKVYAVLTDDLRSVPGPFWARFTRLWYLNAVKKGDFENTNIELHRKHGWWNHIHYPSKTDRVEAQSSGWDRTCIASASKMPSTRSTARRQYLLSPGGTSLFSSLTNQTSSRRMTTNTRPRCVESTKRSMTRFSRMREPSTTVRDFSKSVCPILRIEERILTSAGG